MKRNERLRMDGRHLLRRLEDGCAALAIVDPQYRAIMDRQRYGNEGERMSGRARLPQMSDDVIAAIAEEAERVLRPSGHLAIWMDKYSLASGHWQRWLPRTRLELVELVTWNKARIGMGRRARCSSEFLLFAQKPPVKAKDVWTDHSIPDCWTEVVPRFGKHPHEKPPLLTERIILAVTRPGDLVVDPCAGGFGVLDACVKFGREFVGCDVAEGLDVSKASRPINSGYKRNDDKLKQRWERRQKKPNGAAPARRSAPRTSPGSGASRG